MYGIRNGNVQFYHRREWNGRDGWRARATGVGGICEGPARHVSTGRPVGIAPSPPPPHPRNIPDCTRTAENFKHILLSQLRPGFVSLARGWSGVSQADILAHPDWSDLQSCLLTFWSLLFIFYDCILYFIYLIHFLWKCTLPSGLVNSQKYMFWKLFEESLSSFIC